MISQFKRSLPFALFVIAYAGIFVSWAPKAVAVSKNKQASATKADKVAVGAQAKYKAAILMDATSGEVLFEDNAQTPLPPASMIKLMVAYVTLKKLEDGTIKSDEKVKVSAFASKIGGSQVYLKENEEFSIAELLEALMVQSANDAAMVLAEHIGGTKEGFVDMMNQQASDLNLKESSFHSPHGLPPGKDQEPDMVSAHDFAVLAQALINHFPDVLKYTALTEKDFRNGEFKMRNHNDLLLSFPGCDGLKTGYYAQAGFSITATAHRDTTRLIAVVMGSPSKKIRAEETKRLLSMGFSSFKKVKIVSAGTVFPETVVVHGGKSKQVSPIAAADLIISVRNGDVSKVIREAALCQELNAPVAVNTECGVVKFKLGGKEVGQVKALVKDEIQKGGMFDKLKGLF